MKRLRSCTGTVVLSVLLFQAIELHASPDASAQQDQHLQGKASDHQHAGAWQHLTPYCPSKGVVENIVIFIRFADQTEFETSFQSLDSTFNDVTEGAPSLVNYFEEVSYAQLHINSTFYPSPDGDTIASVQDALPRSHYTVNAPENPDGYSQGMAYTRERALLVKAVQAVEPLIPGDLDIDSDDDGYVDHICFIIRGPQTEWASLLWPHFSSLGLSDSSQVFIHGKQVGKYSLLIEQFASIGVSTGTLAHEMFHTMSAPDLYHYGKNDLIPVGEWDIMSYSWPETPHMGAWMKYQYGHWIDDIPEITQPGTYTLNPLTEEEHNCYKIASPYTGDEFFVLEYRKRKTPFETHELTGSGLLVYRVNTLHSGNSGGPPDELYIYRPGGTPTYNGNQWDAFFSADAGRTGINDASDPHCFLQDGSPGGLNIYNIGTAGETITFTVSMEPASFVTLLAPTDYTSLQAGETVTLQWQSAGISIFTIDYSLDGGQHWAGVAENIADDEYEWTVPGTPSNNCVLRISDGDHPETSHEIPFYISDADNFYPLAMNHDLSASGCNFNAGVIEYGGQIWTALWNMNKISCFEADGTFIESFAIAGLSMGIAGLTYDGQRYMYAAGYGGHHYYKIDPITRAVVDSIAHPSPINTWLCTFDPAADNGNGGLWVGFPGLSNLTLIDLQGTVIRTLSLYGHHVPHIQGIAYDSYSGGGPYLWLFDKGAGQGLPQFLYRLQIATNTLSTLFHDVSPDVGFDPLNIAQDLFVSNSLVNGKVLVGGIMSYRDDNRLFAYDISGAITHIADNEPVPAVNRYSLFPNYPNPFNPATNITFSIPAASRVRLNIYNVKGQEICRLLNDDMSAGVHTVAWDGRNGQGIQVPSGVYLYKMEIEGKISQIRKMMFIR
ncbi:M6 family metalloprotease domain-containing protein [bacterium]|nr:M6 family metalloprotease domain-containing protein [bacterium]